MEENNNLLQSFYGLDDKDKIQAIISRINFLIEKIDSLTHEEVKERTINVNSLTSIYENLIVLEEHLGNFLEKINM